ncbi:MAG: branched-chain amino acid ABC transporter permease [Streptosporangiaceae bacterium]
MRRRLVQVALGLLLALVLAPTALAQEGGQTLHGTIRGPDGKPVSGIVITVSSDGEQVGKDRTGKDGSWEVRLPKPGSYDVKLDTDTLPEGMVPRNEATLPDVTVHPDEDRALLFPLTTPEKAGESPGATPGATAPPAPPQQGGGGGGFLGQVAQLLLEGLKFGVIIAITSIGLSLIFGTTGLINFAHGELVTLGAMTAFLFNAAAVGPGLQLIPAAAIAVVVGALIGWAMERGLWRPLRGRGTSTIQLFIISIGLSLLLRHAILIVFGSRSRPYADYVIQEALHLGPVSITPRDLIIIAVSLAVLAGVGLMLQTTRIGKAMRAVSDNRDLAESSGVDVQRVVLVVWMMGGALAALGGVFFGLSEVVMWNMGFKLLLLMFAGVILGGLGTAYGAMVGGIVVGLVAQLSTLYFSVELKNAWALGVLILVLLVRPQGLLGRAERVG